MSTSRGGADRSQEIWTLLVFEFWHRHFIDQHPRPDGASTDRRFAPSLTETNCRIDMLEGNDIICFCNDWDGDPLSKKHIALRLAKKNRVLWVNSTGNRNPTASVRDFRRVLEETAAVLPRVPACRGKYLTCSRRWSFRFTATGRRDG